MHSTGGRLVTLIQKQSFVHSTPKVLAYWSGSDNAMVTSVFLSSVGIPSNIMGSLEPHLT